MRVLISITFYLFSFFCFGLLETKSIHSSSYSSNFSKKNPDCPPLNGLESLDFLNNITSSLFNNSTDDSDVQNDLDNLEELAELRKILSKNNKTDLSDLINLKFEKNTQNLIFKMSRHLALKGLSSNSMIDKSHLGDDLLSVTKIQMFLKRNPDLNEKNINLINIANNLLSQSEIKNDFDLLINLGARYDIKKRIWDFSNVSGESLVSFSDKNRLKKALRAEYCLKVFLKSSWLMYSRLSEVKDFQSFLKNNN